MKHLLAIFVPATLIFSICSILLADTTAFIPDFNNDHVHRITAPNETDWDTREDVCSQPYGAAVSPGGDYVVVTCQADNSVIIIITEHFTETDPDFEPKRFLLGSDDMPHGVAIDSRGEKAYVANRNSDTVDEIDIRSGTRTTSFDVGEEPLGVAAAYDDEERTTVVYVTNYADDTVSRISGGNVDDPVDVGRGPTGVALTPDGKKLYVANQDNDTVSVLMTEDQSLEATIAVGNEPFGVAVASDGDFVFVTNSKSNTVSIISTETDRVIGNHQVSGITPRGVAAPINGDFAYVVNEGSNNISKITIAGDVTPFGGDMIQDAVALGAFIGGKAPGRPSNLTAEIDDDKKDEIILHWIDNSDDEMGFRIERREEVEEEDNNRDDEEDDNDNNDDDDDNNRSVNRAASDTEDSDVYQQIATVSADVTTFTDKNLSSGETTYRYRIRAYNEAANSDFSNSVEITAEGEKFSWCFINTLLN